MATQQSTLIAPRDQRRGTTIRWDTRTCNRASAVHYPRTAIEYPAPAMGYPPAHPCGHKDTHTPVHAYFLSLPQICPNCTSALAWKDPISHL